MKGNEYEEFLERQKELAEATASVAFGVDRLKLDLVDKGWEVRSAEACSMQLFNTMLMMTMPR